MQNLGRRNLTQLQPSTQGRSNFHLRFRCWKQLFDSFRVSYSYNFGRIKIVHFRLVFRIDRKLDEIFGTLRKIATVAITIRIQFTVEHSLRVCYLLHTRLTTTSNMWSASQCNAYSKQFHDFRYKNEFMLQAISTSLATLTVITR